MPHVVAQRGKKLYDHERIGFPGPNLLAFAPYSRSRGSRSNFMIFVYLITLAFVLLALMHWALVLMVRAVGDFFLDNIWISFSCFMLALLLFAAYVFFRRLRMLHYVSFLIALTIVELSILAVAPLVAIDDNPLQSLICFVVMLLLMVVAVTLGSILPRDLTAMSAALFLFTSVLVFFGMFIMMMTMLPNYWNLLCCKYLIIYTCFIIVVMLLWTMYFAQLVQGWGYAEIRASDGLFASVTLYMFFLVIFMVVCHPCWRLGWDFTGVPCNGDNCFTVDGWGSKEWGWGIEPFPLSKRADDNNEKPARPDYSSDELVTADVDSIETTGKTETTETTETTGATEATEATETTETTEDTETTETEKTIVPGDMTKPTGISPHPGAPDNLTLPELPSSLDFPSLDPTDVTIPEGLPTVTDPPGETDGPPPVGPNK